MEGQIILNVTTKEQLSDIIRNAVAEELNQRSSLTNSKETEVEFLTVKEVTELLKVSKPTIEEWSKKGLLKKLTAGRSVRYKKAEVLSMLQEVESGS